VERTGPFPAVCSDVGARRILGRYRNQITPVSTMLASFTFTASYVMISSILPSAFPDHQQDAPTPQGFNKSGAACIGKALQKTALQGKTRRSSVFQECVENMGPRQRSTNLGACRPAAAAGYRCCGFARREPGSRARLRCTPAAPPLAHVRPTGRCATLASGLLTQERSEPS
jgi:hypothetical protein